MPSCLIVLLQVAGSAFATVTSAADLPLAVEIGGNVTFANLTSSAIFAVHSGGRVPLYAQLLADRVYERARIRWPLHVHESSPNETAAATSIVTLEIANNGPADGYRLEASTNSVRIVGSDERGVLFGVGRLLRLLNSSFDEDYGNAAADGPRSSVLLPLPPPGTLNMTSSPDYPMRGHQLGYREILATVASSMCSDQNYSHCAVQVRKQTHMTAGMQVSMSVISWISRCSGQI